MSQQGVLLDPDWGVYVENGTEVPTREVIQAGAGQHALIAALVRWGNDVQSRATRSRAGTLFDRDRYVTPESVFDQMKVAYEAAETDDVVGGVLEATESLAFSRVSFYANDPDEQDVYNQIAAEMDLDSRLREMWREMFTVSTFVAAIWWHTKSFKVRGKTPEGKRRKKEITVRCPQAITLLDPLKVVPVGSLLFNREQLAYIADREEAERFDEVLTNRKGDDPIVERLFVRRYEPDDPEVRRWLAALGSNAGDTNLFLLNPETVFRHTATRPQYRPFASVRLRSVFELLDLKQQLRQMDRAHLIGAPLRVDQRVATPDGWRPIGSLRVGDQVFGPNGKPTRVLGVFPQGYRPLYRVRFTDGAEVVCDDTHAWTVCRRDDVAKGRPPRTIALRQIMEEGLRDRQGLHRHRVPVTEPLELPDADLPLDPYLLGYLLGNGGLTGTSPRVSPTPGDEHPWAEVLPAGVRMVQYRGGSSPAYGLVGVEWRCNPALDALRCLGLWGHRAEDKFIPDVYLWGSATQRRALLQGLCDSDGTPAHSTGVVEYSTTSPKLAEGVVQLVQSLGGAGSIKKRAPRRPGQQGDHRLFLSIPRGEVPFRLRRKIERWQQRKHSVVRAITAVDQILDGEAVCIKVERRDGLFLTEGMIPTHNSNFIVVITKGTDAHPAKPAEISNLQVQVRTVARLPVLVGDHRLNVEIVTPKMDNTLKAERYNAIDGRITARLYQLLVSGAYQAGTTGDDSTKLAKVIARGLESRRHMLRRTLERHVFGPLYEQNDSLTTPPKLRFHPKSIDLSFDAAFASFLLDLRESNELSRETILSQFDLDQEDEARMLERERETYDEVFRTTVAFDAPQNNQRRGPDPVAPGDQPDQSPSDAGRRQGGRRGGGGAAPGSGQGQPPRNPRRTSK